MAKLKDMANLGPKLPKTELVDIDLIDDNPLSANEEDTITFNRLQKEMEEHGLLEIPILKREPTGRYTMISGKHRKDAFRELGGKKILATIVDAKHFKSREDEFNLVNNMNLIRGDMKRKTLSVIIPNRFLAPTIPNKDLVDGNAEAKRNARINQLILEISKEIAEQIVREKDEMLSLIIVQDTIVSLVRLPVKSKKIARNLTPEIEKLFGEAIISLIP